MQSAPELAISSECAVVPRVPPLGGSYHWGRAAPPIAALSGSHPKAPGSAGGYLRVPSMIDSLEVRVCGVFRSQTSRSSRSRSASLIDIRSIFRIGADSQVQADL